MGLQYTLAIFLTSLALAHSVCHFEQYINSTTQTPSTNYVSWRVNLFDPPASSKCPTNTNPHKRQGVLQINTPSDATKVIIRLRQEGETCFASWHLAMDWTDGYGGSNAELHTLGDGLWGSGRYPGPGPDRRPPAIDVTEFISRTARTELDVSIYYRSTNPWNDNVNEVDKVYPDCDSQKVRYVNQNMFRIDDMKSSPVYLGLNRVVSGRRGREGTGLYYVCIEFES